MTDAGSQESGASEVVYSVVTEKQRLVLEEEYDF
jgi:hypothetical protein